jgi:threonyl-tRNA synthetase
MEMNDLAKKRHTLAHLLAAATIEHYPDTKLTLGPAIDTGFYYDMEFSKSLTDADLPKIEKSMKKLLQKWTEFSHREVTVDEARQIFAGNPYKLELIEEISAKGEPITLYICAGFEDLCRGGHSENPAREIDVESFKLDKVAGAYWRGDEKNKMLTRIYGLAFENNTELEAHVQMVADAKERDHRKLGKELDLFTFSDLVGAGLPLFTPKGTILRDLIVDKIQGLQKKIGYQKVTIPHITKKELYETSGHWEKFGDELFKVKGSGDTEFVMKPMNCPHHTQIYASKPRSYKDLPIRYMETGVVYRDEQAGELLGLARVRSISQDDGHLFVRPDQIEAEIMGVVSIIKQFYTSLGMWKEGGFWVSLSVRDPNAPEKYLGDVETWDIAEKALEDIAKKNNLPYKRVEGEAAFYGPKLDFMFFDALGRERQLGTAQLDFNMPKRFGLEYTDKDGMKKTPVMIHRAVAGSLERFLAIAIEHFNGEFPFWLAPVQLAIIPIKDDVHGDFAQEIHEKMLSKGIRSELMAGDAGFGKRVREAKNQKVTFIMVVGDKEVESKIFKLEGVETFENQTLEDIEKKFSELNAI